MSIIFNWEINIFDMIVAFITVFLILYIYRLLDKLRERKQLETVYIRLKKIIKNYWNKEHFISLNFPYLKFQKEQLGKLGVILNEKKKLRGYHIHKVLNITDDPNINIEILDDIISISIVDKYLLKENVILEIKSAKQLETKEDFEKLLKEIKEYIKSNFNIKIKIPYNLN